MKYRGGAVAVTERQSGRRLTPLLDHLLSCCAWLSSRAPAPWAAHSFFERASRSRMAAVSMAALNCSASLLGLSKTEVDVFVVTNCPFGWGRQCRHGDSVAGKRRFQLDDQSTLWDSEPWFWCF